MDAGGATDESAYLRTAKSCGPDAPTLASSSREAKLLGGEGGNKARSPGRARRKPLKPLRAGMPGDSGATVVTNARAYYSTRAAAGASGTRHSPRPLWGGRYMHNSGAMRREDAPGRRRPRKRAIQYSETSVIEPRSCGILDTPLSRSMTTSYEAGRFGIFSSLRGAKRRSNPSFLRGDMDCFAPLAMTALFRCNP